MSNAASQLKVTTNIKRYSLVMSCLLIALGGLTAQAATIYKKVDADGNVVFTDVPPRAEEKAETIDLGSPNSFTPELETELLAAEAAPTGEEDEAAEQGYSALQITSPVHDATIRDNAGNVTVTATTTPALAPGHALQLLMDGATVAGPSQSATFPLTNVDRGTHQLYAQVVDEDGTVVFTGELSVFHLMRYSRLNAPAN